MLRWLCVFSAVWFTAGRCPSGNSSHVVTSVKLSELHQHGASFIRNENNTVSTRIGFILDAELINEHDQVEGVAFFEPNGDFPVCVNASWSSNNRSVELDVVATLPPALNGNPRHVFFKLVGLTITITNKVTGFGMTGQIQRNVFIPFPANESYGFYVVDLPSGYHHSDHLPIQNRDGGGSDPATRTTFGGPSGGVLGSLAKTIDQHSLMRTQSGHVAGESKHDVRTRLQDTSLMRDMQAANDVEADGSSDPSNKVDVEVVHAPANFNGTQGDIDYAFEKLAGALRAAQNELDHAAATADHTLEDLRSPAYQQHADDAVQQMNSALDSTRKAIADVTAMTNQAVDDFNHDASSDDVNYNHTAVVVDIVDLMKKHDSKKHDGKKHGDKKHDDKKHDDKKHDDKKDHKDKGMPPVATMYYNAQAGAGGGGGAGASYANYGYGAPSKPAVDDKKDGDKKDGDKKDDKDNKKDNKKDDPNKGNGMPPIATMYYNAQAGAGGGGGTAAAASSTTETKSKLVDTVTLKKHDDKKHDDKKHDDKKHDDKKDDHQDKGMPPVAKMYYNPQAGAGGGGGAAAAGNTGKSKLVDTVTLKKHDDKHDDKKHDDKKDDHKDKGMPPVAKMYYNPQAGAGGGGGAAVAGNTATKSKLVDTVTLMQKKHHADHKKVEVVVKDKKPAEQGAQASAGAGGGGGAGASYGNWATSSKMQETSRDTVAGSSKRSSLMVLVRVGVAAMVVSLMAMIFTGLWKRHSSNGYNQIRGLDDAVEYV